MLEHQAHRLRMAGRNLIAPSQFRFVPHREQYHNAKSVKWPRRIGARTELIRLGPTGLFGCGRPSGVRIRFRGNSRCVICHATLCDIRIFSHTIFRHCFLISSPFIVAILRGFLRASSVCFERCGDGSRGGRVWLGILRTCGEVQGCQPSKRATNETKMIFHLSNPVAWLVLRRAFLKACPFHSRSPQTNTKLSRLFLPRETPLKISGCWCAVGILARQSRPCVWQLHDPHSKESCVVGVESCALAGKKLRQVV